MSAPVTTAFAPEWSPLERIAFRFVFVYFTMFACSSLLDTSDGPRRLLAALSETPVRWFGHSVLGVIGDPRTRGGAVWPATQQLVAFLIAGAIAAAWTAGSRRTEYRRMRGWFLIVLRYYVAVLMLIYGGFKVVSSQFPAPTLEQMSQPLGSLAPMGLLWVFMGFSPVYSAFAGLGETIGALLLFFRRTVTAGALVLIGVLSNVALLNYTYDVSVKQLSFNLLLASIVLAAADLRRIVDVFLLNRPTAPVDQSFDLRRPWMYKVRRVLKPLIIVLATVVPLGVSIAVHSSAQRRSELYGVYDVGEFVRRGVAVPPITTDAERWRRVIFGAPKAMAVRLMNDSLRALSVSIDTTAHRMTALGRTGRVGESVFSYERLANGGLRIHNDSIAVTLHRVDHERLFRLIRPTDGRER